MVSNETSGHRERLRKRFLEDPAGFSDQELLELLLTYAIPRENTAPLAMELTQKFLNPTDIFLANKTMITEIKGLGDAVFTYFKVLQEYFSRLQKTGFDPMKSNSLQPGLFSDPQTGRQLPSNMKAEKQITVFVEDEVDNSFTYLPQAINFTTVASFHKYLENNLPYNSITTRKHGVLPRDRPGGFDIHANEDFFGH